MSSLPVTISARPAANRPGNVDSPDYRPILAVLLVAYT